MGFTSRSTVISSCIVAAALLGSAALLTAGPLNPPAGPVAPSYRTLTEVEPRIPISAATTPGDATSTFRISQPGSYYLTGNMTGESGKAGIRVVASDVTIDLNGFTLAGVAGSLHGITFSSATVRNTTIRNGTVVGWGGSGINFNGTINPAGLIEGITARNNTLDGINAGEGGRVVNCAASNNGGAGFDVLNEASFDHCVATLNGTVGFSSTFGGSFSSCLARQNATDGFGLSGGYAVVSACTSSLNGGAGFSGSRGTFHACDSSFNSGVGYSFSSGVVVEECTANVNGAGGFSVISSAALRNNNVSGGTTGILASGTDNRIEGNTVVGSSTGISVTGTGNIIVRNSVTGGTRYSIAAGNSAGPIVTAAGMAANTNPGANYDY